MTGLPLADLEIAAIFLLTVVYFLLAIYRAASLELPRLRMGSVMRQAGRDDFILERWASSPHGHLLLICCRWARRYRFRAPWFSSPCWLPI